MSLPMAEFLTVWALLGVNILSPGPNVLNTIATAIGSGRRAGMGSAAGVGIGIMLWCLGMSLGMAAVFAAVPAAQTVMTLVAVGLLVWFASRYIGRARAVLRARRSGAEAAGPAGRRGMTFAGGFARSFAVNLANPKALTTWLAVLAIFPVARAGAGDIALLCAGAAVMSFAIHTGYALAFSAPAAARAYLRAAPVIDACVGLFFLSFAGRLVWGLAAPGG